MTDLPLFWTQARIGDLCDMANGRAFKPSEWGSQGLPIVRIQNLNNANAAFNYYSGAVSDRVRIDSGDLLFAWSGTPGTSFGAHVWDGGPAVLNQHIFKLTIYEDVVDRDYFCFAINIKLGELIDKARGGVGLRHLTKGKFEETLIELPPIAEQRRIVASIKENLHAINNSRAELLKAERLVPSYIRAVLEKATSGELTQEWRAANHCAIGPTVELGSVAEKLSYGTSTKSSPTGKVPVLRMGNIQNMAIDWTDLVFTSNPKEIEKYKLESGDVLFNRTNSPELVGKTAVYEGERDAIFAGYLIRIRCGKRVLPKYLNYCLNSPMGREYCRSVKTDGVSQSNINARKLAAFRFLLPTTPEQQAIVEQVDLAIAQISNSAASTREAFSGLAELERSVLAKAFRGQLVAQDPSDKPATIALEQLKLERAQTQRSTVPVAKTPKKLPSNPKNAGEEMKKRADVGKKYLAGVLETLGGSTDARTLWRQSDMEIDEFYKQLRSEMAAGYVKEGKQKDGLEISHAS
jgi:type I restriction enzyme S subunit